MTDSKNVEKSVYLLWKREIKFRAWDTKFKKMYWNVEHTFDDDPRWMFSPNNNIACCFWEILSWGRREVMQYTWLKDKNWVEIYEGDLLLYHWEEKINIRFDITGCWFYYSSIQDTMWAINWSLNMSISKNSEVIGNIFEHNHLF